MSTPCGDTWRHARVRAPRNSRPSVYGAGEQGEEAELTRKEALWAAEARPCAHPDLGPQSLRVLWLFSSCWLFRSHKGASQSYPEPCGSTVLGFPLSCPLYLPPKPDLGLGHQPPLRSCSASPCISSGRRANTAAPHGTIAPRPWATVLLLQERQEHSQYP